MENVVAAACQTSIRRYLPPNIKNPTKYTDPSDVNHPFSKLTATRILALGLFVLPSFASAAGGAGVVLEKLSCGTGYGEFDSSSTDVSWGELHKASDMLTVDQRLRASLNEALETARTMRKDSEPTARYAVDLAEELLPLLKLLKTHPLTDAEWRAIEAKTGNKDVFAAMNRLITFRQTVPDFTYDNGQERAKRYQDIRLMREKWIILVNAIRESSDARRTTYRQNGGTLYAEPPR